MILLAFQTKLKLDSRNSEPSARILCILRSSLWGIAWWENTGGGQCLVPMISAWLGWLVAHPPTWFLWLAFLDTTCEHASYNKRNGGEGIIFWTVWKLNEKGETVIDLSTGVNKQEQTTFGSELWQNVHLEFCHKHPPMYHPAWMFYVTLSMVLKLLK